MDETTVLLKTRVWPIRVTGPLGYPAPGNSPPILPLRSSHFLGFVHLYKGGTYQPHLKEIPEISSR